jgi:TonB family protein
MTVAYRIPTLPWTPVPEDERRFRQLLGGMALAALLLSLAMPWLPLPQAENERAPEVPSRYARLVFEKSPPPPAQSVTKPQPEPVREPEPDPQPVETDRGVAAVSETRMPDARERAAKAGVMAFADTLIDLRDHAAVATVARQDSLSAGAGTTRHNERSLITSRAGQASGGVNTASLSRDTGGGGMEGRQTTAVSSGLVGGAGGKSASGEGGSGRPASRSREEIELVFDRNKNAIFALYNRALRHDPGLRGTLVLKLTIAPSGEVTACEVVSSELSDPEFERKLVARVRMFRFQAKDVATVTTTKPIDFFPA